MPHRPDEYLDLSDPRAAALFEGLEHVWQGVAALPEHVERVIVPQVRGEVEDGAWIEEGKVEIHEGAKIERGATVRGPSIIGRNSIVRSGAYVRGHVLIGEDCMVGAGVELRQTLMLDESRISHQNCVFTSLLGKRVWIGGHTSTANVLLSRKPVEIRVVEDGEVRAYPTGLINFGAIVGDDASIGGMSLMQPGALIGRRCLIYSQCTVIGHVPHDHQLRPKTAMFEVVPRKPPR